jgi:hypothetical protein
MNEFNKCYQPRSNIVKDGNGDLLADSHNIFYRWRNFFPHPLNVERVSDVGGEKYIELSRQYLNLVLLTLKLL